MERKPKARGQNLIKSEDGTNGRILSYLCSEYPIEECFKEGFFNVIASNLSPGDQIRCIQITNTRRDEDRIVSATWTGIVLKVNKQSRGEEVVFVPVDSQGIQRYRLPTEEDVAEEKPYEGPQYITGDGRVEKNSNSQTYTVMEGAKEVCTVETRKEAAAIARGDAVIPEVILF